MKQKRLWLACVAAILCVPAFIVPASADPTLTVTVTCTTPHAHDAITVSTVTVTGRPARPLVSIVIRTPSAADDAAAAHARLRSAIVARSEPASLRKP